MIKNADYIIDMGPEGGSGGGLIIAEGSPEELAANHKKTGSYTGEYLEKELALHK
jgi:excinuclease ABC subunit A